MMNRTQAIDCLFRGVLVLAWVACCLCMMTGCAQPTDPAVKDALDAIAKKLDKQPAPEHPDLSPIVQRIDGLSAKLDAENFRRSEKPAEKPPQSVQAQRPRATYRRNDNSQLVIYYYVTSDCAPGLVFLSEKHLVRIAGRPVDFKPFSELPVSLPTPATCPVFFWQDEDGTWLQMRDWCGVLDFQKRFNLPARSTTFQAAPVTYAAYSAPVTYTTYAADIDPPIVRTAVVPVVRYGPILGLPYVRRERVVIGAY